MIETSNITHATDIEKVEKVEKAQKAEERTDPEMDTDREDDLLQELVRNELSDFDRRLGIVPTDENISVDK